MSSALHPETRGPAGGMRWLRVAGAVLAAAGVAYAGVLAHAVLFGHFSRWDDEGWQILALRAWRDGGGLYDRVRAIYGPFYFQFVVAVMSLLRLPFDNVGARWFVLGIWEASSLLCALTMWRSRRSVFAAFAVWALSFSGLVALEGEPLHPGGLVALFLPTMALVSLQFGRPEVELRTWALLGALTAALALTKLNLGLFVLIAVVGTWLRFSRFSPATLAARLALGAFLLVLPFALMHELVAQPWVPPFALLAVASFLPFALQLFLDPGRRPWRPHVLLAFAAGGLALALVSLGVCFTTGSSIAGVWNCLVLDTIRFPALFWIAPVLPPLGWTLGALAVIPVAFLLRRSRTPLAQAGFFALKLAVAAYVLWIRVSFQTPLATWPYLWIFALPARCESTGPRQRAPLAFLAWMVALQGFHIYPVAGSQQGFFSFMIPLLVIAGLWEAWEDLPGVVRARVPLLVAKAWTVPTAVAGVVFLVIFSPEWRRLRQAREDYETREIPLGLPGAESLRLPEERVLAYAWLAANVRRQGDTFLGVPGMMSLYLWTGQEPPATYWHVWPLFYDAKQQQELGEALLAHENVCVVRVPSLLGFWSKHAKMPEPVLERMIRERFQEAITVSGIEIWTLNSRKADLVLYAKEVGMPADAPQEVQGCVPFRFVLPEMEGVRIARFGLVDGRSGATICDTSAPRGSERMILADDHGRDLASPDGRLPPIALEERTEVLALFPPPTCSDDASRMFVRCYDEQNSVVARLPILGR